MCHEVYNFPIPGGVDNNMEMRDLFDFTPKELISKVVIEEKVFETWFDGRTVLLGDACHKFNPSGPNNVLSGAVSPLSRGHMLHAHALTHFIFVKNRRRWSIDIDAGCGGTGQLDQRAAVAFVNRFGKDLQGIPG